MCLSKIFGKKQIIKGRRGFYREELEIKSAYRKNVVILYVIEIERFENNLSKVALEYIEIEACDDPDKIDWLKIYAKKKFISIVKTDKVEWLIPTLKNDRKDKILEINKK